MASRSDSSIASFTALLSFIMLMIVAAGIYLVWTGDRAAPLRTVELQAPLPDLPEPPGLLPDAEIPR